MIRMIWGQKPSVKDVHTKRTVEKALYSFLQKRCASVRQA